MNISDHNWRYSEIEKRSFWIRSEGKPDGFKSVHCELFGGAGDRYGINFVVPDMFKRSGI